MVNKEFVQKVFYMYARHFYPTRHTDLSGVGRFAIGRRIYRGEMPLSKKEAEYFHARFGPCICPQAKVAKKLGYTPKEAEQVEKNALTKLKQYIDNLTGNSNESTVQKKPSDSYNELSVLARDHFEQGLAGMEKKYGTHVAQEFRQLVKDAYKINDDQRNTSISDMSFSNTIKKNIMLPQMISISHKTAGDLVNHSLEELAQMDGIGKGTVKRIVEKLAEYGLRCRE